MSSEWVTAVATAGTFVVIAASAIAALFQLRHMRTSNQISAYNECRETMDGPEFREALSFIRNELPERLRDPQTVNAIAASSMRGEFGGVRLVANLFESMGLFVRWNGIVLDAWRNLRPLTAELRKQRGVGIWVNFEYMAVLADDFTRRFPDGGYPKGVRRMPLDEPSSGQ